MSARETATSAPSASQAPRPRTPRTTNWYLIRLTVIATLGGLLFGYDTGVISGALLYMRDDLQLSALGEGIVVSSLLFGAMFGALFGGKAADRLGRKGNLLLCAVLFLVGALGTALALNVEVMVAARIVLGLAVGAASVTVPLYLAEMSPAQRRGRMVTINELMIVSGQLLAYIMNSIIDQTIGGGHVWRVMLGVAAIPAVVLFVGMLTLPDSPRWYALKGRFNDTRRVLRLSRDPHDADAEYDLVVDHAQSDTTKDRGAAMRTLRQYPWMRRILWIGIGLAIVQQATGVNTLMYYGTSILASTGLGASASIVATIALGVVAVIGCVTGIVLLGRFNRRPLLITGTIGVAASHGVLALCFMLPQSMTVSFIILAAMLVFMFLVQTFAGPLVWLMLSEIFPLAIRGFAMGVAIFMLWTVNMLISFAFPLMAESLGSAGTFAIFILINAVAAIFVIKHVPETRGRTLEELEEEFRNGNAATPTQRPAVGVHGS